MLIDMDRRGSVAVITMNRPERRNAFNAAMTQALDAALNSFEDDDSLRAAVLTGGRDFFSAGTDLVEWAGEPTERGGPYGIAGRALPKPLVAAVEGVAAGGGFEIALSATLIVASETASFSLPEVKLGLIAECGGIFRGPRALPLNLAREMLLTGSPLSAARAFDLGMVNRLAPQGAVLEEAIRLAEEIAERAPVAVAETLHALEALFTEQNQQGWELTQAAKTVARASADAGEGVAAFRERRAPQWRGH
ncbi:enoyl-CoA hydratase-related protein [Gordonia hydrophobica]|uniref:Enoyl-CoA hydratase-related protein n=1 Tax=Gordonia hydrophobica TaxID=40516 RepID=A0ABZ2TY26_9ACTN|nr:enoyl-CoA hydratase-related protein [Gordonia hydrophobica]MBM7366544.1 enoyl-CoA hydratase/carnithine racemase [Gordonia hydrophobica]